MSRNLGSTSCECGFWRFSDRVPMSKAAEVLNLNQSNYNTGPYGLHGYGFRDDLNGVDWGMWKHPTQSSWSNFQRTGYVLQSRPGHHVDEADRYRWGRVDCPVCRRPYLGWFRASPEPTENGELHYEIYDLSYFHAFNDEPCAKDLSGTLEWDRDLVVEALRSFAERFPDRVKVRK